MSEPNGHEGIEIDPLLEFSTEGPVTPAGATVRPAPTQAVVPPPDPPKSSTPPPPDPRYDAMRSRIDTLQRSIDDTRKQVTALKSEVATLVRLTEDKPRAHPALRPAAIPPLPRPSTSSRYRIGSAVAAVVVGILAAVFLWMKLSGINELFPPPIDPPRTEAATPATPPAASETEPVVVQAAAMVPVTSPAPVTPVRAQRMTDKPRETPRPTDYRGTLSIDSNPGGEVFINRQTAGHTPLSVPNLRAGAHLVWIERDGYRRWTRVVEVPADQVTRLSASLEPLSTR